MHFESLEHDASLAAVTALQQELSEADSEMAMLTSFARRFREIAAVTSVIELDTRGLAPGEFRVADRLQVAGLAQHDGHASWAQSIPAQTSAVLSEIVRTPTPKLVRAIRPVDDDVLAPSIETEQDAVGIPVFIDGNVDEWLILLTDPGSLGGAMHVRSAMSNVNLLSRSLQQQSLIDRNRGLAESLQREIDAVARVQQSMLPSSLPDIRDLTFSARYRPSAIAGGDYYDYVRFDDGTVGVVIADVSGHGPAAAVVMAVLRTILAASAEFKRPPANIVEEANRILHGGMAPGMFVTAFFIGLDPETGHGTCMNAGHHPPLIRSADGDVRRLSCDASIPLGITHEIDPAGGPVQLEPGDTLILFTDGITEAGDPSNELYGETRLMSAVRSAPDGSPDGILAAIDEDVARFLDGAAAADDQCMIAMRFR